MSLPFSAVVFSALQMIFELLFEASSIVDLNVSCCCKSTMLNINLSITNKATQCFRRPIINTHLKHKMVKISNEITVGRRNKNGKNTLDVYLRYNNMDYLQNFWMTQIRNERASERVLSTFRWSGEWLRL